MKGRRSIHHQWVDVRELARELILPVGWLSNAMEARLIERVFKKDRVKVRYDGRLIGIPSTFASDPLEIDD